jgi:hypothetical protein
LDRVSGENGEQPILSVFIDKEKSTFENKLCNIKEHEEGIISDSTVEKIRFLLEKALPNIRKEEYEVFIREESPIINIIYDVEDVSVNMNSINPIKNTEHYEKLEKEILKSAEVDLEIAVR